MKEDLEITSDLVLPADELVYRFSRSGGPGGQHVNKLETRVELVFNIPSSRVLSRKQKQLLRERLRSRLDTGGALRVVSQKHRSQRANKLDARKKLRRLLAGALKERKKRVPTRPTAAAEKKRLAEKRRRAEIKKLRRKDFDD